MNDYLVTLWCLSNVHKLETVNDVKISVTNYLKVMNMCTYTQVSIYKYNIVLIYIYIIKGYFNQNLKSDTTIDQSMEMPPLKVQQCLAIYKKIHLLLSKCH